jgi:hypothetical protein
MQLISSLKLAQTKLSSTSKRNKFKKSSKGVFSQQFKKSKRRNAEVKVGRMAKEDNKRVNDDPFSADDRRNKEMQKKLQFFFEPYHGKL